MGVRSGLRRNELKIEGAAKVRDDEGTVGCDQDVGWGQIPMHNVTAVHLVHCAPISKLTALASLDNDNFMVSGGE